MHEHFLANQGNYYLLVLMLTTGSMKLRTGYCGNRQGRVALVGIVGSSDSTLLVVLAVLVVLA